MPERRSTFGGDPRPPTLAPPRARELLEEQVRHGRALLNSIFGGEPVQWTLTARKVLGASFGVPSAELSSFEFVAVGAPSVLDTTDAVQTLHHRHVLARRIDVLQSCIDLIDMGLVGEKPVTGSASLRIEELRQQLGFLAGDPIEALILRDLAELEKVFAAEAWKSALLLAGSILEGVLIDVLDRNRTVAGSYMKRSKFPEDASLNQLIAIAGDEKLLDGGRYLLSSTAKSLATTITEHRDLIHPFAEISGKIKVDRSTAEALGHLLTMVVRDLSEADGRGDIQAYADK